MGVVDWIVLAILVAIIKLFHYVWTHRKRSKPKRWHINSAAEQSERVGRRRAHEAEFGKPRNWAPVAEKQSKE